MDKSKLARKFDRQARIYEKQRKKGVLRGWRQRLLEQASGEVLELAVGAGANFAYYNPDVQVTAVDISPRMLEKAKEAAKISRIQANFIQADIETLVFPKNKFDTIVSTLSFCGYDDPVRMFNQLGRWCKQDGRILVMEHGISTNPILALVQKGIDPFHYKMIGCHQKRDMMEIIQASNLRIQQHERHWQGIFHLIWATPSTGNE